MRRKDTTNEFLKECMADALIKLLSKKSLDKITIKDITDVACVGRVTFYRNFKVKEDLIKYKITLVINDYFKNTTLTEDNITLKILFKEYFLFISHYKDFMNVLFKSDTLYLIQEFLQDSLWYHINRDDILNYRKAFFSYGIYGITKEWIQSGYKESPEQLSQMVCEMLNSSRN